MMRGFSSQPGPAGGLVIPEGGGQVSASSPFVSLGSSAPATGQKVFIETQSAALGGEAMGKCSPASRLTGLLCTLGQPACCEGSGLVTLTGTITGLASVSGVAVPYEINGAFAAALTDAEGRYRITAHPCDNVLITAPEAEGYFSAPEGYAFSPVCQSRAGLDFQFAAATLLFNISLASQTQPAYNQPPNLWPFDGSELRMAEGIVIELGGPVQQVKYAAGLHDTDYFQTGGTDITDTWRSILPITSDGIYTVYARFAGGAERVLSVTAQGLRDGTRERPFLLLDFPTAAALESVIPGIGAFTLAFMQGGGSKLASYYQLYEDIDMAGRLWKPLGEVVPGFPFEYRSWFTGGIFGDGHSIQNMTPDAAPISGEASVTGLFGCLGGGAELRDLTLENYTADISPESIQSIAGGFAGILYLPGDQPVIFANCAFTGSLACRSVFGMGAFIAYAPAVNGTVTLSDCRVNAVLAGLDEAGGFVGLFSVADNSNGALNMRRCVSQGSLTGLQQNGGLVGALQAAGTQISSIRGCANLMTVTADSFYAGGIVGVGSCWYGSASIRISACFNGADIFSGGGQAGGIVGRMGGVNSLGTTILEVTDCYSIGDISVQGSASDTSGAGGLVGLLEAYGLIVRSYAAGAVFLDMTPAFSPPQTGGLTGAYGMIMNSAALCPSITASLGALARVGAVAVGSSPALTNNLALDTMAVLLDGVPKSPMEIGPNLPDGESRTAESLIQQTTYEAELGWDFENTWLFGNGDYTLPVLREIPLELQPTVLPAHLG